QDKKVMQKNSLDGEDQYLRFSNERDLKKYLENPFLPYEKRQDYQELSREDRMAEFMFLGLRKMKGIDYSEFSQKFSCRVEDIYGEPIKRYIDQGLMTLRDGSLALTDKGINVSNQIFCDFI
ncbi:MAG: coproporphyrinogen III oxidase, partial [Eubacterium sp.]|nr:coproporphyrinogen III oxidase [Eubacterium sp.]